MPTTKGGTQTILLVDDDDQLRRMCSTFLTKSGFRVLEADNALDALLLGLEQKGAIDLLITDFEMPQISGAELGRTFQRVFPTVNILFMSGSLRMGDAAAFPSNSSFLPKPVSLQNLVQAVRSCIDAPACSVSAASRRSHATGGRDCVDTLLSGRLETPGSAYRRMSGEATRI